MNGERPLTFDWPQHQRSSWQLAGLIFLMLFLHSGAFFLFRTETPPRTAVPRSAIPVQLISSVVPDGAPSPDHEQMLRWIATADPALVAEPTLIEPPGLLDIPYRPSYSTLRTAPLSVPPEPATVQYPPVRDPLTMILSAEPQATSPTPAMAVQLTRIHYSASISNRAPKGFFSIKNRTSKPIETFQCLLGIAEDGGVKFIVQQQSSGDTAMDADAIDFLRNQRFQPAQEQIVWGRASIYWGDDAVAPTPP